MTIKTPLRIERTFWIADTDRIIRSTAALDRDCRLRRNGQNLNRRDIGGGGLLAETRRGSDKEARGTSERSAGRLPMNRATSKS